MLMFTHELDAINILCTTIIACYSRIPRVTGLVPRYYSQQTIVYMYWCCNDQPLHSVHHHGYCWNVVFVLPLRVLWNQSGVLGFTPSSIVSLKCYHLVCCEFTCFNSCFVCYLTNPRVHSLGKSYYSSPSAEILFRRSRALIRFTGVVVWCRTLVFGFTVDLLWIYCILEHLPNHNFGPSGVYKELITSSELQWNC